MNVAFDREAHVRQTLAALALITSLAATAHAQPPIAEFADLSQRLGIGETVVVTTREGTVIKGKVERVSEASLLVRQGRRNLTLTESDVARIARRGHAVRRGALVGLAAGFSAGAAWAAGADDCTYTCISSPAGVLTFGGLFGAVGLGVGAIVGAALNKERPRPGRPSASAARIQTATTLIRAAPRDRASVESRSRRLGRRP